MTKADLIARNAFLKQLGFSGAAILATVCLGTNLSACSGAADTNVPPLPSDITLDLTATGNAALKNNGGYLILSGQNVIVAKSTVSGSYIAATIICSDEGKKQITYRSGEYQCSAHSARFDESGKGLNSVASRGLKIYQTTLSGNTLTVKAA